MYHCSTGVEYERVRARKDNRSKRNKAKRYQLLNKGIKKTPRRVENHGGKEKGGGGGKGISFGASYY